MTTLRESDAPARENELVFEMSPDPADIPPARHLVGARVGRWGFESDRRVIELLASELLARVVIHSRSPITIRVAEADGRLHFEARAEMTSRPQRLATVAHLAVRRSDAILAALATDYGAEPNDGEHVCWFDFEHRPA